MVVLTILEMEMTLLARLARISLTCMHLDLFMCPFGLIEVIMGTIDHKI